MRGTRPEEPIQSGSRGEKIKNFTDINHPFQEPHNPDIVVDTEQQSVAHVENCLKEMEVLAGDAEGGYAFDLNRTEEQDTKERLSEEGYLNCCVE